jgi:hypothetical protein
VQLRCRSNCFQRIGAAEVDRGAGRRFDVEDAGDGIDGGIDGAARERQAMIVVARREKLKARARLHLDLADVSDRE